MTLLKYSFEIRRGLQDTTIAHIIQNNTDRVIKAANEQEHLGKWLTSKSIQDGYIGHT